MEYGSKKRGGLTQYHVVWSPKYRRKVLVQGLDERLKEVLREVAVGFDWLRSRLPTLWTNCYFASTVGGAPLEIVKQYIESKSEAKGGSAVRKTYKFQIDPTPQQARVLDRWLYLCRRLYNAMLEQRIIVGADPSGAKLVARLVCPRIPWL